jgi:hypothetical protein
MDAVSAVLLPWQRVRVSGPSMVPTLYDGDVVVVRHTHRIRSGDIVLARFRDVPERLVVKRAVSRDGSGWHVRSDNESCGRGQPDARPGRCRRANRVEVVDRNGSPQAVASGSSLIMANVTVTYPGAITHATLV